MSATLAESFAKSHIPNYRADVDGLRAVAVLSVVVFHAFPEWLPGGFIGVDMFFVISGFLITGLILKNHAAGRFSLTHFYARRTLRIFPALMLILLLGWCVGWLALGANEYRQYSKYMTGGAAFVNNFLFWKDSGYFDNLPDTKPLLHLWSLAVEEQFYLAWPLVLLGLLRWRRAWPGLVLLGVASFGYSLWKVQTDLTGAFYSPLSRFWELLVGAGLALHLHQSAPERAPAGAAQRANVLSGLGVLGLGLGMAWIHPERHFPGAWALLPVAGAALLIASGHRSWWGRTVLSHPAMVWVGLISYPLYLWHWPLLSFARILHGSTPPVGTRAALLACSVGLAYLTYRWLERPIRFGRAGRATLASLLLGMLALLLLGQWTNDQRGLGGRHQDKLLAHPGTMTLGHDRGALLPHCGLLPQEQAHSTYCKQQSEGPQARWLVLGDSKAEALYYGLARSASPDLNWVLVGGLSPWGMAPWGAPVMDRMLDDPQLQGVVLVGAMRSLMRVDRSTGRPLAEPEPSVQDSWLRDYEAFASRWLQRGKQVVLVRDHPTLPDPNDCIEGEMTHLPVLRHLLERRPNALCRQRLSDHLAWSQTYDRFLNQLQARQPKLVLYSPLHLLCDPAQDHCPMVRDGAFLYSYGDHLSDVSNTLIARDLLHRLKLPLREGQPADPGSR